MKLNIDCIRDVLLYLEESLKITPNNYFVELPLAGVQAHFQGTYSSEDVFYSVYNLQQAHMIECRTQQKKEGVTIPVCIYYIINITYEGHQFLNTIRPQTVWEQTKSISKTVGSEALEFVKDVAHDLLVECGKQAINLP